jgi:fumarate hydratase class II
MSQSSNDMFPSAMHIAAFEEIVHKLIPSLHHLNAALVSKEQEFSGYAAQIPNGIRRAQGVMTF